MKNLLIVLSAVLFFTLALTISGQQVTRIPVVYYSHDSCGNIVARKVKQEIDPRSAYPGGGEGGGLVPGGDTMIIVYPNPTVGPLTAEAVNYSGAFPLRYELYTEGGALLQTLTSREALTQIEMSRLSTGIYILQAKRGETVVGIQIIKVE
ncbi:MAG: T9SS type A sorting domain-containing protein [Muribaculaceae bacterium]|nr:T9SS type A sorting domain-containing protein [Muribaculaceae bacterium]